MRVSSKVALSSGLLAAILIAVLGYNIAQVRRLAEMQRGLAEIELRATAYSLDQQRLMPQLESLLLKYLVTRDRQYLARFEELRTSFEVRLEALEGLELSDPVRRESDELRRLWEGSLLSDLPLEPEAQKVLEEALAPDDEALLGVDVRSGIERIRAQLERVTEATREAIEQEAERTLEASRRAQTFSWLVVAVALACAVPILWVTVRSIRDPLRRLEEGTRSVARGIYSGPRLDASRHDEFSEIATSFNEMVARLGELDQMKRDFLSHVSHELRTPLVAMDETHRLLLEGIPGPLNEKQRKLLELNLEGSRRLAGMISKLLDLAQMEERAVLFELQTHDLVELADKVVDSFLARARELDISIELTAPGRPVLAECDGDRIIQLLGNLIDNALKHSPSGGTVEVRILRAGERSAQMQVRDAGPGVPDEEKERIFEKFHQVGRPRTGSVGLGLAICKQIVEAHHGAIWVEDNEAGGSVFCVRLSAAAAERTAQAG